MKHDWRQWTMTPVEPIGVMADGSPSVVQRTDGEAETKIFCMVCMTGLNPTTMQQDCPGEPEDDDD
jgi:hypothetical protein